MQIHASIETHEGTEVKEKFVLPNEYKIGAKLCIGLYSFARPDICYRISIIENWFFRMSNSYSIVVSTERKILEKRKMK